MSKLNRKFFFLLNKHEQNYCLSKDFYLKKKDSPLFQTNIRQWIVDLLLTMDLFNEQLYIKVSIKPWSLTDFSRTL